MRPSNREGPPSIGRELGEQPDAGRSTHHADAGIIAQHQSANRIFENLIWSHPAALIDIHYKRIYPIRKTLIHLESLPVRHSAPDQV